MLLCRLLISGILLIGLSSCGSTSTSLGFLGSQEKLDPNLPMIPQIRTIADVSSIALEWDRVPNPNVIKGFVIFQNNANNSKKIATIKNPYVTHYVVDSLLPETSYSFQIATLGVDNAISQKTKPLTVKTSFIDPVERVFASKDYAKKIKLIWSPHPNPSITRYIIQRKNPAGVFLNIATVKNRLLVEYFDENLADAQDYTYRIIAKDLNGVNSRPSAEIQGSTRQKPKTITSIQASQNLAKNIQLSWEAVPDINRYEIYTADALDSAYKPLVQVNKTYYTHKIGKDSVELFYKVRAIDDNDVASDLPNGAAKGATLPPPPTPVITKGQMQDSHAFIEWEIINHARVKAYAVYRYEGRLGNLLRFSNTIQNSFTDKEMQKGKRYIYKVVSVDGDGNESLPSKEVELLLR